jgi:hypothetical protein
MRIKKFLWIILLCVPIAGCNKNEEEGEYKTVAVIKYFQPFDSCEGYMIGVGEDEISTHYFKPVNLPEEYQVDDLYVEVSYNLIENVFYDCKFSGYKQMITITKIRKL